MIRKFAFTFALSLLSSQLAHSALVRTTPSESDEGYWTASNPSSHPGSPASNASQAEIPFKEEKRIATGLFFKKYPVVFTSVRKDPVLGEGWKDPDGLIWFDIALDDNGIPIEMTLESAVQYCGEYNARLPTFDEGSQLAREFSARVSEYKLQYTQQILAHPESSFWLFQKDQAYVFFGDNGDIQIANPTFKDFVRCVRSTT
jgi:hypothetical protein